MIDLWGLVHVRQALNQKAIFPTHHLCSLGAFAGLLTVGYGVSLTLLPNLRSSFPLLVCLVLPDMTVCA